MPPKDPQEGNPKPQVSKQIVKVVGDTIDSARQFYVGASATLTRFARSGQTKAVTKLTRIQKTLGEDYHRIFEENSLVLESLSYSQLLVENKELLSTAFNLPWTTATLWAAASGSAVAFNRPVGRALGGLFHYGPGHVQRWSEVNTFMDSVSGSGHRLKYGHSIDSLPDIVEQFGVEGVPAFFCHVLQDFTTSSKM